MHPIDWAILGAYLAWMIWDGLRLTKHSDQLEGYFLGGRSLMLGMIAHGFKPLS